MKLDLLFDEYYFYSYLWFARLVKNWIKKHIKMFCLLFVTLNKKVYNCSLYNEKIKAWLFICQNYFFWKSRFSIIEKFFNIVKKIYNYIHFFTANYYQNKLREFHFFNANYYQNNWENFTFWYNLWCLAPLFERKMPSKSRPTGKTIVLKLDLNLIEKNWKKLKLHRKYWIRIEFISIGIQYFQSSS